MDGREGQEVATRWLSGAVAVFGLAVLALLVILIAGGNLSDAWDDVLPLAFAVAALAAFAGWSRDRRARGLRAVQAEKQAREAREALQHAERERDELREEHRERGERLGELEPAVKEKDDALRAERDRRRRTERARQSEREWARELREQVLRMYKERGTLGDSASVPELVLETAIRLVDAKKGLLLARQDEDGDGKLDLIAARGFEGDAGDSEIAQRFADKVIDKDEIIREDRDRKLEGEAPADDEINCLIAIPIYIANHYRGIVVAANRTDGFEELDDSVLLSLGDHAGAALENRRLHGELRGSYIATVRMLADTIEAKDPEVRVHSDDVAKYVAAVADELTMESKRREQLIFASLLHDVGKIGISERILLKPDQLTDEERSVVELHPRIGCRLMEQVPALQPMTTAVLHHHERYDGNGYPSGLKGEDIPLEARIVCVADCFCAMTSDRPYKEGMSVEEACEELERCAGTQFDPRIVRLFVEQVRKNPPRAREERAENPVFNDPEIQSRRNGHEPVLGYGTTEITDNLTLLYTHRYFHEVAAAEAERAQIQDVPFAVVMIRLEDLEDVNLSDGFAAGDDALRSIGRVVRGAAARWGDATPSRYSGRRFAILMPRASEHQARTMLSEVVSDIEAMGRTVRGSLAVWEPGDSGSEVVGRARLGLDLHTARA